MLTRRTFIAATLAAPTMALAGGGPLKMRDLYEKDGSFSKLAQSLQGERVEV